MVVGTREGANSRFLLFPFIKHAVLNGQTGHTKGYREIHCVIGQYPFLLTGHVMVSMALTNLRASFKGRKFMS